MDLFLQTNHILYKYYLSVVHILIYKYIYIFCVGFKVGSYVGSSVGCKVGQYVIFVLFYYEFSV